MKREKERYRRGRPKPSAGGGAEELELEPAWCTMAPMVARKSWSSRY